MTVAVRVTHRSSDVGHRVRPEPWPLRWRALLEIVAAYVVLVAAGVGLGLLVVGPLADSGFGRWETQIAERWTRVRTPDLNDFTRSGSDLAGTINVAAAVSALVAVLTWVWKRWKESLTLALALGLEAVVFVTVSVAVGRERPPVGQLDSSPPTASFPSGHVGAAFALYFGLALVVWWRSDRTWLRSLAVCLAAAAAVTVAVSRMYRGMHYVSDVTVGALLGLVCLAVAAVIVERGRARASDEAVGS